MQNAPISLPTKLKVAYLYGKGETQRKIAIDTDISKSSVNRYIQIMKTREENGKKDDFKTQIKYHFVLFNVLLNPFLTNLQISKRMQDFEFKTSESSVSRIIKALNIKNKTQKPKEKLNQRQKDNRILFCKNLLKNELYSFPFVFTDESMIALDPIKKK